MECDLAIDRCGQVRGQPRSPVFAGVGLVVAVAIVAWALGILVPAVPTSLWAVGIGIVASTAARGWNAPARRGIAGSARWGLIIGLAGLGLQVDGAALWATGPPAVILAALAVGGAMATGALFLRTQASKPNRRDSLAWLLAIGTGVCGASAIVAARGVVGAKARDAASAVAAVTLLGTLGMLLLPLVGQLLNLDAATYGAWVGASLHAVPQVMAAAAAHPASGPDASASAAAVKMLRVALLPVAMLWLGRRLRAPERNDRAGVAATHGRVPMEVWVFGAALLAGLAWQASTLFPSALAALGVAGRLAFLAAFAALGLQTDVKDMAASGGRTLSLAIVIWLVVLVVTGAAALLLMPALASL